MTCIQARVCNRMDRRLAIRLWALTLGLSCHLIFILAIWKMFWGIESGFLETSLIAGRGITLTSLVVNVLLLAQFPLLHSLLLTKPGKRLISKISLDANLAITSYALISSLQLLLFFIYWHPTGTTVFTLPKFFSSLFFFCFYIPSWIFLAKTMFDSGLGYQTGAIGWWAVFRGKKPIYPSLRTKGSFSLVRQPIYLAFFLILWTSPSGELDRLLLAVAWGAYLYLAPRLKERRFKEFFGEQFLNYQSKIPYFFPRITKLKNARD